MSKMPADIATTAVDVLCEALTASRAKTAQDGIDIVARAILAERERSKSLITEFANGILHGDNEHRGWLLDAADAFNAGKPLPAPRGKGAA